MRPWFDSWVGKICWRRDRLPTPVFLGFPCGSAGKKSTCNAGDLGFIPVLGRSPGEGKGYSLQYSGLENSMDYTVHGVAKSWTRLSDFHVRFSSFIHFTNYQQWETGHRCAHWGSFPGGSAVKNPPANAGDVGSIPGFGRSPGEGNGIPLQ